MTKMPIKAANVAIGNKLCLIDSRLVCYANKNSVPTLLSRSPAIFHCVEPANSPPSPPADPTTPKSLKKSVTLDGKITVFPSP